MQHPIWFSFAGLGLYTKNLFLYSLDQRLWAFMKMAHCVGRHLNYDNCPYFDFNWFSTQYSLNINYANNTVNILYPGKYNETFHRNNRFCDFGAAIMGSDSIPHYMHIFIIWHAQQCCYLIPWPRNLDTQVYE